MDMIRTELTDVFSSAFLEDRNEQDQRHDLIKAPCVFGFSLKIFVVRRPQWDDHVQMQRILQQRRDEQYNAWNSEKNVQSQIQRISCFHITSHRVAENDATKRTHKHENADDNEISLIDIWMWKVTPCNMIITIAATDFVVIPILKRDVKITHKNQIECDECFKIKFSKQQKWDFYETSRWNALPLVNESKSQKRGDVWYAVSISASSRIKCIQTALSLREIHNIINNVSDRVLDCLAETEQQTRAKCPNH